MPPASYITLSGLIHADTPDAVLFGTGEASSGAMWLPRSALTIEVHGRMTAPARVTITLPRDLARRKNLLPDAPAAQPILL